MYNNPYYNNQDNLTRIDNQIKELENMRNHLQRPQPSINQTFQLAPSQTGVRFSDSWRVCRRVPRRGIFSYYA